MDDATYKLYMSLSTADKAKVNDLIDSLLTAQLNSAPEPGSQD